MPTGLIRRGGRYSLRRRIPLDLLHHFGRGEIVRALGTSDPKEARKRHARLWVELDDEFERARATQAEGHALVPDPPEHLSPTYIALSELDSWRERRLRAQADGDLATFTKHAHASLKLLQAMLDGEVETTEDLRVLEGRRNALRAFLYGESAFAISAARKAQGIISEEQNQRRSERSTTWSSLVDLWAAERAKKAKSKLDHASVARLFEATTKVDRVEKVTRQHAVAFKEAMVRDGMSPANLKVKLSRLRTLTNFAFDNDLSATRPFQGIRVIEPKLVKRRPFDAESLDRLFGGPVHKEGARPTQGRGEAAFWLPLLALFTGARLGEIAQLRLADVRREHFSDTHGRRASADFLRFATDESEGLTLKTPGSERLVPLHPWIVDMGFLAYVESLRCDGHSAVFPDLTAHRGGSRTHKWGQWFSTYLRQACKVTDRRIVFHSFRHSFKDNCRNSLIEESLQRALMGHSGQSVADSYGSGHAKFRLVDAIKSYNAFDFNDSMIKRPSY